MLVSHNFDRHVYCNNIVSKLVVFVYNIVIIGSNRSASIDPFTNEVLCQFWFKKSDAHDPQS
jgi:hypothetical protein